VQANVIDLLERRKMSESRNAWIALNLLADLKPALRARMVESCDGPLGIWSEGRDKLRSVPGLRIDILNKIGRFDWKRSVLIELERAQEAGFTVLTPADASYPPKLLEIPDPPPALYVRGSLRSADEKAVAVVGSRNASSYGLECARRFGADLTTYGLTVVSGLAMGADAAAHEGALEAGGRTIAVLGSGVDVPYPRRNRRLLERIAEQGAVVSEFPLGTQPMAHHFPQRNRVIAGLCLGTLVVEATARSGSLITAREALDYGRDVFAVPGRVTAERSVGTNVLIRNQQALLVLRASDVVEALRRPGLELPDPAGANPPPPPELPAEEAAVLACIDADHPVGMDSLAGASDLPMSALLDTLLSLEMRHLIRTLPGGRYIRRGPGGGA
jgi:DNA processing protein